jgi:hypothetical protein
MGRSVARSVRKHMSTRDEPTTQKTRTEINTYAGRR